MTRLRDAIGNLLDRDLGADLRSGVQVLTQVSAVLIWLADFADEWKVASGGALTFSALITVIGRSRFLNQPPPP